MPGGGNKTRPPIRTGEGGGAALAETVLGADALKPENVLTKKKKKISQPKG